MHLSEQDRRLIEELVFDPNQRPSFDLMKSCLVWPDERPSGLSREGRQFLARLWIVRGFKHRGIADDQWGLDSSPLLRVWQHGLAIQLRWPGFQRLDLSEQDRVYLQKSLSEAVEEA